MAILKIQWAKKKWTTEKNQDKNFEENHKKNFVINPLKWSKFSNLMNYELH